MAIDTLGLIGFFLIVSSLVCWNNERLCKLLGILSAISLLFAYRVAYAGTAICILIFGSAALWSKHSSKGFPLLTRLMIGGVHIAGLWLMPFFLWYGYTDAYSEEDYVLGVGHVFPATFIFATNVLVPLWFAPPGYQKFDLKYQIFEATPIFVLGLISFLIYRIYHTLKKSEMKAVEWEHELLGLIWSGCGFISFQMGHQKISTHIASAIPALYMCYKFLNHNHDGEMDTLHMLWISMHKLFAMCFGLGGLCRLVDKMPESVLFMSVATFILALSPRITCASILRLIGDQDSDAMVGVALLGLVVFGVVVFAFHVTVLARLRNIVEDGKEEKLMERGSRTKGFETVSSLDLDENRDLEKEEENLYMDQELETSRNGQGSSNKLV